MIDKLILQKIGINVSRETFLAFDTYISLLKKWQKAINLVSNSTLADVENRHILDSLQIYPLLLQKNNIADLGSGAGFPGMVIGMLDKNKKITLVESDIRKCEFLKEVKRTCHIDNINVLNTRIEKIENLKFDCIVSRALASVKNIIELSENIREKDCTIILLKGEKYKQELDEAMQKYDLIYNINNSITDRTGKIISIQEVK